MNADQIVKRNRENAATARESYRKHLGILTQNEHDYRMGMLAGLSGDTLFESCEVTDKEAEGWVDGREILEQSEERASLMLSVVELELALDEYREETGSEDTVIEIEQPLEDAQSALALFERS